MSDVVLIFGMCSVGVIDDDITFKNLPYKFEEPLKSHTGVFPKVTTSEISAKISPFYIKNRQPMVMIEAPMNF